MAAGALDNVADASKPRLSGLYSTSAIRRDCGRHLREGSACSAVPGGVEASAGTDFRGRFRAGLLWVSVQRRAHDAIAEIHFFGTKGYRWVLDADIEVCFDRIDHSALMDRVRRRVKDKRVLRLVEAGSAARIGDI